MQSKFAILWPMFALAAWTVGILLLVATRRILSGVSGKVHPREYALGESQKVPAHVSLANRNYMNLLELPVLFHAICLVAYVTHVEAAQLVLLAWAYVALRVAHSLIHVTYNHVMHRFAAFAASNFVLVAMWVIVGRALANAA